MEEQQRAFSNYSVEQQFDLYLYCENVETCWRDSESPQDHYGQWMAQDNRAETFLIRKLEGETNESVQRDIIYVLRFMAVNGHLKGERHIAEVVNQVVGNMNGNFIDRIVGNEQAVDRVREWAREIEVHSR